MSDDAFTRTEVATPGAGAAAPEPARESGDDRGPNPAAKRHGAEGSAACDAAIGSAERDLESLPSLEPDNYVFGGYFARGGMGRIAAARDRRLGRVVALKECISSAPQLVARFEREALVTARLEHPAIVPVYEAGRWPSGEPFFAMKKVAGESLKEAIEERATLDERLDLLPAAIAVVDALAYAHAGGVVHRDLKPANVLVGEYGETVVIDWGLAKTLDGADEPLPLGGGDPESSHTVAGSVLGTPAYMAPEQARGDDVDERSDVYALGAILYTMLAGAAPYEGDDAEKILAAVLEEAPPPLGERQRGVPPDLETIVAKAMARDPDERYPNARELARELKRFRTGQLVAAHAYSRAELVRRWLRRYRTAVVVGAVALLALAAIGGVSVWNIMAERDRARRAEDRALERAEQLAVARARELVDSSPRQALELLSTLRPRSSEWSAARTVAAEVAASGLPRRIALPFENGGFAVSPDGTRIAVSDAERTLYLVDVASGERRELGHHDGRITAVDFSSDGALVATSSMDNDVALWSPESGKRVGVLRGHQGSVLEVRFSPRGDRLVSVGFDQTTRIWSTDGRQLEKLDGWLRDPRFSADGSRLTGFDVSEPRRVRVHDVGRGVDHDFELPSGTLRQAALSPDGRRVAAAASDGAIRIWDVDSGEARLLGTHGVSASSVAFTPDGQSVISGGDRSVRVWPLSGSGGWSYQEHRESVARLEVSPDGGTIAAHGARGELHLIDVASHEGRRLDEGARAASFTASGDRLIAVSGDHAVIWTVKGGGARIDVDPGARSAAVAGDAVALGGPHGSLRVWDLARGAARDVASRGAPIVCAAASPNGALVAALDERKRVRLFQLEGGESIELPGRAAIQVVFSPDGSRIAAPGDDGTIRLWDVATGKLRSLEGHAGWVAWVAFSPDGQKLVSVGSRGEVRSWSVGSGEGRLLGRSKAPLLRVVFAPSGQDVVTAGENGAVKRWPLSGGEPETVAEHHGWALDLAYSDDGAVLASAGSDGVIHLVERGRPPRSFEAGGAALLSIDISPDGRSLVAAAADGEARLWDLASGTSRRLRRERGALTFAAFARGGAAVVTLGKGVAHSDPDALPHDPEKLARWLSKNL